VARAHSAGKPALICVGGAGSYAGFQGAASAAQRATFVSNLVGFVAAYGYDGLDVDWEPIEDGDTNAYAALVQALRTALDALLPRPLLTAATASQPALFAALQSHFDQINLMTYELAGPWPGWVTWFNAPLYDGSYAFPSTGEPVPSTEGMASNFAAKGVAPGKLGIGIAFYGYVWAGGAGTPTGGAALPRQEWTSAPTVTAISYADIMAVYWQTNRYHWDAAAQAAYLSIDQPGATNDKFISYDDEYTCGVKVSYARNRDLGGVMIWELGQGYRADQPAGQRDPLLQAVKRALATPCLTAIALTNADVQLSFSTLPLALYRVQTTTNLAADAWDTLTNNLPGNGADLQILDQNAGLTQRTRFYRVRTPP
jgi:chitinase